MDASRPKCEQLLLLKFYDASSIFAAILGLDVFYTKPSWRFCESPRKIDI
jgi:hypothetical protein